MTKKVSKINQFAIFFHFQSLNLKNKSMTQVKKEGKTEEAVGSLQSLRTINCCIMMISSYCVRVFFLPSSHSPSTGPPVEQILFCRVDSLTCSATSLVTLFLLPTLVRAYVHITNHSCLMKPPLKISKSKGKVRQIWSLRWQANMSSHSFLRLPQHVNTLGSPDIEPCWYFKFPKILLDMGICKIICKFVYLCVSGEFISGGPGQTNQTEIKGWLSSLLQFHNQRRRPTTTEAKQSVQQGCWIQIYILNVLAHHTATSSLRDFSIFYIVFYAQKSWVCVKHVCHWTSRCVSHK